MSTLVQSKEYKSQNYLMCIETFNSCVEENILGYTGD